MSKPTVGLLSLGNEAARVCAASVERLGGRALRLDAADGARPDASLRLVDGLVCCDDAGVSAGAVALIRAAIDDDMPVYALGGGMQLLNIAFGGKSAVAVSDHGLDAGSVSNEAGEQGIQPDSSLPVSRGEGFHPRPNLPPSRGKGLQTHPDLPATRGEGFHPHPSLPPSRGKGLNEVGDESAFHHIYIAPGSRLAAVVGSGGFVRVNSRHGGGIREAQKSPWLLASAYSLEDGVIEALESSRHRWVIGVQFNPERRMEVPPHFDRLFQSFVERAVERMNSAEIPR